MIDLPDNTDALLNTWLNNFRADDKHLMFTGVAVVFWTIWKIRNSTIFDNAKITDPCVLVNMIARWLNGWIVLQKKQENQRKLKWVVRMLEQTASEVFRAVEGWRFGVQDTMKIHASAR